MEIPHDGLGAACEHGSVARVVWSVREGKVGEFDAPELAAGYRSAHPAREPKIGEVLAQRGIDVVGFDNRAYLRGKARTPDGTGADVARAAAAYLSRWIFVISIWRAATRLSNA